MQDSYTAAMKVREISRCYRKLLLLTGVAVFFFLAASNGNVPMCIKLGHQIRSMDETYDKMVQSFPKALGIIKAIRQTGGIMSHLPAACERAWLVRERRYEWWMGHGYLWRLWPFGHRYPSLPYYSEARLSRKSELGEFCQNSSIGVDEVSMTRPDAEKNEAGIQG